MSSLPELGPDHQDAHERLLAILQERDPLLDTVLRGHLLIEEVLDDLVTAYAFHPQYVSDLRLTFYHKLNVARAFNARHVDEPIWKAIGALNTLRNDLAHRLTSAEREERVRRFLESVREDIPKHAATKAAWDGTGSLEEVALALAYLVGSVTSMRTEYRRRARILHLMTQGEARILDGDAG